MASLVRLRGDPWADYFLEPETEEWPSWEDEEWANRPRFGEEPISDELPSADAELAEFDRILDNYPLPMLMEIKSKDEELCCEAKSEDQGSHSEDNDMASIEETPEVIAAIKAEDEAILAAHEISNARRARAQEALDNAAIQEIQSMVNEAPAQATEDFEDEEEEIISITDLRRAAAVKCLYAAVAALLAIQGLGLVGILLSCRGGYIERWKRYLNQHFFQGRASPANISDFCHTARATSVSIFRAPACICEWGKYRTGC